MVLKPGSKPAKRGTRPTSPPGLAARIEAVRLIAHVLDRKLPLSDGLDTESFRRLASSDRGFAYAIAATSLRRKGQLDAVLTSFIARPLPVKARRARHILLTAAAQLVFLETPPHAAIDMAVALAGKYPDASGFKGLINAVLRRIADQGPAIISGQDAALLNTPDWLWRRWSGTYGDDTARTIADAHLDEPPLDLIIPQDTQRWADRLGGTVIGGHTVRLKNAGAVDKLPGYEDGVWWVQDYAASLPARLLGDVAGKTVLDLCAAPGGKTLQLAASGARVIAVDKSKHRIARLRANLARMKLDADLICADAAGYEADHPIDAILLDAPCSSTGTIRRHPDIPHLKTPDAIATAATLQARLLAHAATLLGPGGVLVYCTCSLEAEEGIAQAGHMLKQNANAAIARHPIAATELDGHNAFVTTQGDLRTLPHHPLSADGATSGLDGFFAARFIRNR